MVLIYMIEYPYYKKIYNLKEVKKNFSQLKNKKIELLDVIKARKISKNFNFEKCEGKFFICYYNYDKMKKLQNITDYFSEKCRVKCKKLYKDKSPIEKFDEIKNKMYDKDLKKFRFNITYYLWKNSYLCQLFKIPVIQDLYKYFNAKNILDFSSGWGDRLIAACSLDVKYTGVDPSNCMKPIYKKIINTLVPKKKQKNYKVIHERFEKTNLKEKFDFIFSSPPFFTLETYEKKNIKQSIKQYSNVKDWKNKFLFVLINKCYNYLEKNRYFCIHISNIPKFSYVQDMLNYIKNKTKFTYVGKFYYIYKHIHSGNKKILYSYPMYIRVFKK